MSVAGAPNRKLAAASEAQVQSQLEPGEEVAAWFEPDLSADLQYSQSLIVLTTRRVLAFTGISGPAGDWPNAAQWWRLNGDIELQNRDFTAAGAIELVGADRRLAVWRYTSARASAAHRFVQRFAAMQLGNAVPSAGPSVCPSCGGLLDPATGECFQCQVQPAPPAASSLLRLVQFARPRAGMISLGFVLTVLGTAASLVPPYLTMPLIDEVLIPHSSNEPYDRELVYWLLSGLALAAVVAWLLDWAKTYVLAWVSERISADMRSRTYRHLQELSL